MATVVSQTTPKQSRPEARPRGLFRALPSDPGMVRVLGAAFVIGVALRLAYFLSGRSLWIDEARLALNVASRSYSALLRPLDYD